MLTVDNPKPTTSASAIRPYRPGSAEAERLLRTEAFVAVPVLARVLKMSPNLVYRGIKDGSVPSVKVGSKVRIPTKGYREMLPPEPATEAA